MPGTISLVTYDAAGKPRSFRGLRKEDVLSCAMQPEANGAPDCDGGWDRVLTDFDEIAAEQARSRAQSRHASLLARLAARHARTR